MSGSTKVSLVSFGRLNMYDEDVNDFQILRDGAKRSRNA